MGRIAIIGSGLAAISAAKGLIQRGIKPVVLDCGQKIPDDTQHFIDRLSKREPQKWSDFEKSKISENGTVLSQGRAPKKLVFGSDFFYGEKKFIFEQPIQSDYNIPPFSLAYGGFANGWGGAVLPADDCDLESWPIKNKELKKYYQQVLSELPLSAVDDDLSNHFPLYTNEFYSLQLRSGNRILLDKLNKRKDQLNKMGVTFGQARLLTQVLDNHEKKGCRYCGYCLSGCAYACIYKPNNDFDDLTKRGLVDYEPGVYVHAIEEFKEMVCIYLTDKNGQDQSYQFQKVFLAAGAVGSARIILQSKKLFHHDLIVKATACFLAPLLRVKGYPLEWPHMNTQPGVFVEYKVPKLSNHWVHTQLATPNELVLQKLGILKNDQSIGYKVKKSIAEHLLVALCNLHSDHSLDYIIKLKDNNMLFSNRSYSTHSKRAIHLAARRFFTVARKFGAYVLLPFIYSGEDCPSYHLGGSLPMKDLPAAPTDTDVLGIPKGWSRTHVIDSSVFPSLPGTTIGLLAMANARRIVDAVCD